MARNEGGEEWFEDRHDFSDDGGDNDFEDWTGQASP